MNLNLKVEKKEFKNGNGEIVEYMELSFDLLGNKIRVKPVDEDKKLCTYLLKSELGGNKA